MLRVGKCFLEEQLEDPEGHDLLALATTIEIPITVIHGDDDQTVQLESGEAISRVAKHGTLLPIQGGNHVFNTPNPFPLDGEASPQLQALWEAFLNSIVHS